MVAVIRGLLDSPFSGRACQGLRGSEDKNGSGRGSDEEDEEERGRS